MSIDDSFAYPLRDVTDSDLQQLGQTLWDWQLCGSCDNQPSCLTVQCPWNRAKRLGRFWDCYRGITAAYVPELLCRNSALRSHGDLLDLIRLIKSKPDASRTDLTTTFFVNRKDSNNKLPDTADQHRAFNIAARFVLMVNCSRSHQSVETLENGHVPFVWKNNLSISRFISEAFPATDHPYFDEDETALKSRNIKTALAAKSLKKDAGLRFEATDDLRDHLKLDHKNGTVQLFHQTAVLKESLLASQSVEDTAPVSDFVRCGNIPRALALETLDTIHKILFPPDRDSQALLSSLVSRAGFDEECLRYESAKYRKQDEESSYHYFGSRLAELYDELQNPTPRSWFQTWLERKSGARYVMMATLIGVGIAIVIGLLGLGVASFQAWVAYQQWKHPVQAG